MRNRGALRHCGPAGGWRDFLRREGRLGSYVLDHEPPAEVHVAKLDPLQGVVAPSVSCGEDDAEPARRYGVEAEDHQRRGRRELANGAELRPVVGDLQHAAANRPNPDHLQRQRQAARRERSREFDLHVLRLALLRRRQHQMISGLAALRLVRRQARYDPADGQLRRTSGHGRVFTGRRRESEHGAVTIEIGHRFRLRQGSRKLAGALHTRLCPHNFLLRSSGVIHGPPLPHQPASLFIFTSRPSRWASVSTNLNNSRHCGPANRAGPGGVPCSTSMISTPPMPTRRIDSRSAVMPSRVMLPLSQNQ